MTDDNSASHESSAEGEIVPLHQRDRFLTEDAFVAHNFPEMSTPSGETEKSCLDMTRENPFRSCHETDGEDDFLPSDDEQDQHEDDNDSDVSSISNDSRRRYAKGAAAAAAAAAAAEDNKDGSAPPPKEICLPLSIPVAPQWLTDEGTPSTEHDDEEGTKEESKVRVTPPNRKPNRMHRGISATPSSLASASESFNSSPFRDASVSGSAATPDYIYDMLGNRPRRAHHRGQSLAYSIGSLVGQSVVTAPTSASSVAPSTGSVTHQHLKAAHSGRNSVLQHSSSFQSQSYSKSVPGDHHQLVVDKPPRSRRRNPMKQEMLHAVKKLAAPVKKLYSGNEQKAELRRSNGCLT